MYLTLFKNTLAILTELTKFVQNVFHSEDVVHRLSQTLNFNIVILTSERCKTIEEKSLEKYDFNRVDLLSDIAGIYLNLRNRTDFLVACALDKHYRHDLFVETCATLQKYYPRKSIEFENLISALESVKPVQVEHEIQDDDELGGLANFFSGKYLDLE